MQLPSRTQISIRMTNTTPTRNQRKPCVFLILLFVGLQGFSPVTFCEALSASSSSSQSPTRRDVLQRTAGLVVIGGSLGFVAPALANDDSSSSLSQKPIAILGASGRTGALCVATCLAQGLPVRACTRSGTWTAPTLPIPGLDVDSSTLTTTTNNNSPLLDVQACNVQDPNAVAKSIQGCRAVIYAASASKQGGDAAAIDDVAAVEAARACLEAKVPRYVLISSTATTRPNSLGYKFTNVFSAGIMDAKRRGEIGVAQVYQQEKNNKDKCSFTTIRPGGLEEPKRNAVLGPSTLEVSQGDVLAGVISRADLAVFSVALATSISTNLYNTALEHYYEESVTPCEGKFAKLLQTNASPRYHGSTYADILQQVQPNVDYYIPG